MNDGYQWVTTGSNTSGGSYAVPMVFTNSPPVLVAPSAGHIPSYQPPALAEDELGWLRRRITEVTDLFPAAA